LEGTFLFVGRPSYDVVKLATIARESLVSWRLFQVFEVTGIDPLERLLLQPVLRQAIVLTTLLGKPLLFDRDPRPSLDRLLP